MAKKEQGGAPTNGNGHIVLTRAALIEALQDAHTEYDTIEIPELGGVVRLRGMTSAERDSYEGEMAAAAKDGGAGYRNFRAKLVARCLVNDQGDRLLQDGEAELLGLQPSRIVDKLFDVASRLSRVREGDVERAKDELKNAQRA